MGLTPRELQVLQLAAEGFTNVEIGEQLYISEETVKRHMQHIAEDFGVRHLMVKHRPRCIAEGFRRGLIQ